MTAPTPAPDAAAVAREAALGRWRKRQTSGPGACYCAAFEPPAERDCLHCIAFRDGWAGEPSLAAMVSEDMRQAINAGRAARRRYERAQAASAAGGGK